MTTTTMDKRKENEKMAKWFFSSLSLFEAKHEVHVAHWKNNKQQES